MKKAKLIRASAWGQRGFLTLVMLSIFSSFAVASGDLSSAEKQSPPQESVPAQEKDEALLMTLDVKDADIKDVMRMFSHVSGLNIVVSDDVKSAITISLTGADWQEALTMLLRTNNLTSVKEGKFLRIMTYERFRREEEGIPLVTQTVFLNFLDAQELSKILEPMRSIRGRLSAHAKTNSLVITETPETFAKMQEVIKKIDKRTPQVMIEAMMVDIKLTDEDRLGINWTVTDKERPYRSIAQFFAKEGTGGVIRYGKTILPLANLSAALDMWAQNKKAEILANPKILTLDGLMASIELKDEIPFLTTVASPTGETITTSASFKEGGIKLFVTPHISVEGFVALFIKTEQSFQSGTITAAGADQPVIDTRKAETNLLVADGETIVIGGLRKKDATLTTEKLPLLGDIPFLGRLFQRRVNKVVNTELLIFVTPYIISEPSLSPDEKNKLKKFENLAEKKDESKSRENVSWEKSSAFGLRPPQ